MGCAVFNCIYFCPKLLKVMSCYRLLFINYSSPRWFFYIALKNVFFSVLFFLCFRCKSPFLVLGSNIVCCTVVAHVFIISLHGYTQWFGCFYTMNAIIEWKYTFIRTDHHSKVSTCCASLFLTKILLRNNVKTKRQWGEELMTYG